MGLLAGKFLASSIPKNPYDKDCKIGDKKKIGDAVIKC